MDEYREGVVGAKSRNLASLRGKLPDSIKLPASVTVRRQIHAPPHHHHATPCHATHHSIT
jgi:hypothetical protein